MNLEPEIRRHVESLARDALENFDSISTEATRELREARTSSDVFAMPAAVAAKRLGVIHQELTAGYRNLTKEPAIARVMIQYEDETERTWYICRATPVTIKDLNLASYLSPIGRLASLEVQSRFKLPNGKIVRVLQQARFRPSKQSGEWDSHDTRVETDFFGAITVRSLRALLEQPDDEQDDILGRILAKERSQHLINDGVRRSVITKMELRDQPVLDRFQDEIFRLPIDGRLLIVGPPGTGKTTTLIRRLGQKLDRDFLRESELRLVNDAQQFDLGATSHEDSWIMFTPTVLLKQYLKEAFARERVPASDQNIKTWDDYRRDLAKNEFQVLKAATEKGTFVLRETPSLKSTAQERLPQCFTEFDEWQRDEFMRRLRDSAHALATGRVSACRKLGRRLEDVLKSHSSDPGPDVSLLVSLSTEIPRVRQIVGGLRDESAKKIDGALNLQLNRDSSFLDDLARYVNDIQQTHSRVEEVGENEIETEIDDEEDSAIHQTERNATINVYRRAVRAQARAAASRRAVRSASTNWKIIEWLGDDRTLAEPDRIEVGIKLLAQTRARRFMNPAARYVSDMPRRYRTFRNRQREHGKWYNDGIESNQIHPLELDFILLAILRAARGFLSNARVVQGIADPEWSFLKPVLQAYRNQVLVDEATDFSPIQLACMADLTHPKIRSFFACGDYNQRLTTWGTRSEGDLKWACDGIEIKDIKISYRQTRQLSELTREMMLITGNVDPAVDLPANTDNDGPKPVLLENAADGVTAAWLAERIREIELFSNQLPSTAIFVNSEDDVEPVAKALNATEAMIENNVKVVACPKGLAVGQDNDVRVFDVQHIKGLEFEAVFFVAVDRLADRVPTLFEKYLYVGATRAATYLGITCEGALPQAIEPLRHHFGIDWK